MIRRTCLPLGAVALAAALVAPAVAQGPNDILPDDPAKTLVVGACTSCHEATVIVSKSHTADEWDALIGKMVDRGAQLTDAEQEQVYAYLVKNFGVKPAPPTPPAAPSPGI